MTEEPMNEQIKRQVEAALAEAKKDWEALHRLRAIVDHAAAGMKLRLDVSYYRGQSLDLEDHRQWGRIERLAQTFADQRHWLDAMVCMAALLDLDRRAVLLHGATAHEPRIEPSPPGIGVMKLPGQCTGHDEWRRKFLNGEYLSQDE